MSTLTAGVIIAVAIILVSGACEIADIVTKNKRR
jgi:hypothetical protein